MANSSEGSWYLTAKEWMYEKEKHATLYASHFGVKISIEIPITVGGDKARYKTIGGAKSRALREAIKIALRYKKGNIPPNKILPLQAGRIVYIVS